MIIVLGEKIKVEIWDEIGHNDKLVPKDLEIEDEIKKDLII